MNSAVSNSIRSEFATVDGLRIRYAAAPKDGAPTVMLLSPWPQSLYAYVPIWDALRQNFSLIAVDLPGFGQSEGRADVLSPDAMGQFVIRLADHFSLDRFHAIGPDIGTPTLLFAASEQPDRFLSLIVGSGAATFPLAIDGLLKAVVEAPSTDAFASLDPAQTVLASLADVTNYQIPQFVKDDFVESYSGTRFIESMALVRHYPGDLASLSKRLPHLTTPVQIIVGKDDPFGLARDGQLLHEQLSHSSITLLPGGHAVWLNQAPEYARIALAWLGGDYETTTS